MSAISKIQASLASATQETTFALANLNFDFSLWKVEAPAAYHPLGSGLSLQRRSAAESGQPHIIARRLGSLFETLLPSTPSLINAYGTRASEIAQAPGLNTTGSSKSHGPFQQFVGLDGTSIWAAATSGPNAVAVHLLACMLARVWSPAEAVSIWEELVAERKKTLVPDHVDGAEQSVPIKDVVASQLAIDKEQLAEWDASARAWLRAADASTTVGKNQQALNKLLNSLSLPIGSQSMVYDNVCKTWVTALTTVDKLVQGHPYSAQDGAVLLALSSWHLYPDLIVLGTSGWTLHLSDALIAAGGALTIGLQSSDLFASRGVHWSLSLAHLRYYGGPVLAHGKVDSDTNRLSFPEFLLVALGALIASWGLPIGQIQDAVRLVTFMKTCLSRIETHSWLDPIASAASTVSVQTDASGSPQRTNEPSKLVRLGHRRRNLLTEAPPNDIFHLRSTDLSCLMTSTQHQVEFYRSVFKKWDHKKVPLVLRFEQGVDFGFATVVPETTAANPEMIQHTLFTANKRSQIQELCSPNDKWLQLDPTNVRDMLSGREFIWERTPSQIRPADQSPVSAVPSTFKSQVESRPSWPFNKMKKSTKPVLARDEAITSTTFEFVGGDFKSVSLYCLKGHAADVRRFGDSQVSLGVVTAAFEEDKIDALRFGEHMIALCTSEASQLFQSCSVLACAARLYECMPSATVSPRVLESSKTIGELQWATDLRPQEGTTPDRDLGLTRAIAFSCIAYFESGFMDVPAKQYLDNVMAISSGDSLYVAAPLLCDPASDVKPYEIHRVIGNIGRAGLAFLIPPQTPMVRSANSDSWRLINHEPFDGRLEDNFRNTTLHLGFTGYEVPLTLSDHGGRFVESFFIEAVVSVHDSGRWVADLDVLSTLAAPSLFSLIQQPTCEKSSPVGTVPEEEVISLDNWEELLDPPSSASVVRAHGNWQARLAAACVSVTLGHPTILFRRHGCWTCAVKVMESLQTTASMPQPAVGYPAPPVEYGAAEQVTGNGMVFVL
ncbi:hypothetical protein NLU13_3846 [Sarocladium strictum]|uniref:Uncharacterized protein n=1 Tax=Sarocladium strictum TaxID=5046 RepID=A0AA39GHT5_SARSR|nr:hypothetical protein NLU13_3846 [Sarocladium strictum]